MVMEALPEIEKPRLTSGRPTASRLRTAGFVEQLAPGLKPIGDRIARIERLRRRWQPDKRKPNIVVEMSRVGRPVSLRGFGPVWRTEDIFPLRRFFAFATAKLPGGALPETSGTNDPAAAVLPFPPTTFSVPIDFFELFPIYMSSKPAKPLTIVRSLRKQNLKAFAPGA
jgi:hypothetical protein